MNDDTALMSADAFNAQLDALGLKQADLCRILQFDSTTVNRWAKGRHPVPITVALLLTAWGVYPRLVPEHPKLKPGRVPKTEGREAATQEEESNQ